MASVGAIIEPEDLEPFADIKRVKAEQMIEDAESLAALAAPCLIDPDFLEDDRLRGAAKAIIRGAILRWNDSGSGAVTQAGAGPFQQTVDTRTVRRSMFWPSEVEQLRDLCSTFRGDKEQGAFSVDTAPSIGPGTHLPWCALAFGAVYCSCGADIAGRPIFEGGTP